MTPETLTFNRKLGVVLRKARMDAGMTQRELSWQVGVSAAQMSQYERGNDAPSVYRLLCIADVLGKHYATLIRKALVLREWEPVSGRVVR